MLFSTATIALVATLLPAALAAPAPIQKRFSGAVIRSGRTNGCLTAILSPGQKLVDGTLLTVGNCDTASRWEISPGSGSVVISGTNFALDGGVPQGNNAVAKVWTSYPGSPQQTWYLTDDNRIAITGGDQCLDQGDNGPQTYQCTTGNTNQVWYVEAAPITSASTVSASTSSISASTSSIAPSTSAASVSTSSASVSTSSFGPISPPSASASASSASTSSASVSPSANSTTSVSSSAAPSASAAPIAGAQIKWKAQQTGCLSVISTPGDGVPVSLQECRSLTDPVVGGQLFSYTSSGLIQLVGTNYCLDAGTNPSNGVGMKLWTCYSGLAQQTWQLPSTGLISTANNQCLNIDNSDYVRIQTWACSQPDVNQGWVF